LAQNKDLATGNFDAVVSQGLDEGSGFVVCALFSASMRASVSPMAMAWASAGVKA
jgi:hypothetical protein